MKLPPFSRGLSARLLVLTAFFVLLAEVLIFVPSVARFRLDWLTERLAAGHLAALSMEAAPTGMVTRDLERKLLDHVGAHAIDLAQPGTRVYMLGSSVPPAVDAVVDLRVAGIPALIGEALATLARTDARVIKVVGASPRDAGARVEIVLDEAPLRAALVGFAGRIAVLSIVISLITAGLVYLSLHRLLVRPMRRITASLIAFRRAPEDPASRIVPDDRADEVGMAERELADMQAALRTALRQRERLATLGTAVTRINHDLRNILATAALASERLLASDDPAVRRVAQHLLDAVDRAVALCGQTLSYSRDGVLPLHAGPVDLHALVEAVGAEVQAATRPGAGAAWVNRVPRGLTVRADAGQLARALGNLGRNAVQAGAGTVTMAADAVADRLILTIADDGPGLPPRTREHLFQPFVGSARAGGTGLGLAIAREVARAHDGALRLVASDGRGTVFALELPAGGAPNRPAAPSQE